MSSAILDHFRLAIPALWYILLGFYEINLACHVSAPAASKIWDTHVFQW